MSDRYDIQIPATQEDPWGKPLGGNYYSAEDQKPEDPLESPQARAELQKILGWYYYERDRQAVNRMEMAMDNLFYDNEQWDAHDAAILRERGQLPLVYNEVAPMVDWLIGTERRTKVDWKVLPRTEDDVQMADVKTKTLKYVSDINRAPFARSRAFADAIKVGVGWIDDGARDDPTEDVIYSKYEDWRNVLWDSNSYEYDLSDARYVFRWRWVDLDIAIAMFPDQEAKIRAAARDQQYGIVQNDDLWYLGENLMEPAGNLFPVGHMHGVGMMGSFGQAGIMSDSKRHRVKLIECQYRKPAKVKIVRSGPMAGSFISYADNLLLNAVQGEEVVEKVALRVHFALFTEGSLISFGPSTYRHNRFTLTPIWCYRRGRDRLPYGVIRRVRDIQMDLNKRASKALFMLNTNQIIMEEGATDDIAHVRDEADRPDGVIVRKRNYELELRRDTDAATGQINMMTLAAQTIQKVSGVNNENLGRETNAVSGAAIEARQNQGSVSTTEPFDNLRYATQVSGEKQLSLCEQFYSEEKVIRISGSQGSIEWLRINKPEVQPDGTVRFINDITASQADFVVREADYAGSLRQVMFDSLQQLVQKLPPEVGLRLFTLAMDFSDLPNHKEIADSIRKMTGDVDPSKEPTPEEQAQMEQQQAMQAEAMQIQREQALLALDEQRAKVAKLQAEAQAIMQQDDGDNQAVMQVRQEAAAQIDQLTRKLNQVQVEMANKTMQIDKEIELKKYAAELESDTKLRIAELQRDSDERIAELQRALDDEKHRREVEIKAKTDQAQAKEAEKKQKAEKAEKEKTEKAQAKQQAPAQPIAINVQIDAKTGETKKQIQIKRDADGKIVGADVNESKTKQ